MRKQEKEDEHGGIVKGHRERIRVIKGKGLENDIDLKRFNLSLKGTANVKTNFGNNGGWSER